MHAFLNVYRDCEEDEEGQRAQNYLVMAPAVKEKHEYLCECLPRYMRDGLQWVGAWPEQAHYDERLNERFPWLWRVELLHFSGYFKENHMRMGKGLRSCQHTPMHVQRLPKPEDLSSAPKGNLIKLINVCHSGSLMI